jgi:signal transduction histidine kinase
VDATGVLILLRDEAGLTVAATAGEVPAGMRGSRLEDDVRAALRARGLGAEAALLVPLVFRGHSVGILAAVGAGFDDEDDRLLGAFAASAATAVATARSVAEERLRHSLAAAEAERSRWARELHDETLQGLGGLRMMVSAARRAKDPDALDGVIEQINTEIENLRALIRELRPAALDELGAVPAIEELAARMAERHGIEVDTAIELEGRRPGELETALYRIIQEALGNAVRHAGATRVSITAREDGGAVHVAVVDDGRGFDPGAPSSGFGLVGMRERVELLGGEIDIASSGAGTRVTALLPR